jgi:hypothetical protein
MPTLLNEEHREDLRRRLESLRPDSAAKWGRFSAPQMVSHVIQSIGMMTGAVPVASKSVPWAFSHAPVKHLLIYVLPFPKGLPTAPELLARPCEDASSTSESAWSAERDAFARALDTIPEVAKRNVWPAHPAMGSLTAREWGTLQYRHLDHHFRQFGI